MFPLAHTVTHITSNVVGVDALGHEVTEHVTRQRAVYGFAPKSTTYGDTAALSERVITEVSLLTPDSDWKNGDSVILSDGRRFVVRGEAEDMNRGPFGFTPGYIVTLRRVYDEGTI